MDPGRKIGSYDSTKTTSKYRILCSEMFLLLQHLSQYGFKGYSTILRCYSPREKKLNAQALSEFCTCGKHSFACVWVCKKFWFHLMRVRGGAGICKYCRFQTEPQLGLQKQILLNHSLSPAWFCRLLILGTNVLGWTRPNISSDSEIIPRQ